MCGTCFKIRISESVSHGLKEINIISKLWMKKILNSKYGGEFLFVQDIDLQIVDMWITLWKRVDNH